MRTIIRNARVWTGVKNAQISEKTILVEGNRIKAILEADLDHKVVADTYEIDAGGQTILPGLINLHTHLSLDGNTVDPLGTAAKDGPYIMLIKGVQAARIWLEAGVTTVRDVGAPAGLDFALKKAINGGYIQGPRMLVSGRPLCQTGGHFRPISIEIDGVESAGQAAREQLQNGADLIKVMATGGVVSPGTAPGISAITIGSPQLTVDEIRSAAGEAYKAGATIAAHAHGTQGIKNALQAGVTTVEHCSFLDEETARMAREKGVFLVSTLSTGMRISGEEGKRAGVPEAVREAAGMAAAAGLQSFRLAHQHGVKIALGTDSGMPLNPHGSIVAELKLLIQAGLSPDEALMAATRVAAEAIGLGNKIGTIETGKLADIMAVRGDPLVNIECLDDVAWVMKDGRIIPVCRSEQD